MKRGADAKTVNCVICGSTVKSAGFYTHVLRHHNINSVEATKLKRYDNSGFNNRIKARKTLFEKYGIENVSCIQYVKDKKAEKHYWFERVDMSTINNPITSESKLKSRLSAIRRIENRVGQMMPNYNPSSIPILEAKAVENFV